MQKSKSLEIVQVDSTRFNEFVVQTDGLFVLASMVIIKFAGASASDFALSKRSPNRIRAV